MEAKRKVLNFFLVLILLGLFLVVVEVTSFGIFGFATLGNLYTSDNVLEADFDSFSWNDISTYSFAFIIIVFCAYVSIKFLSKHHQGTEKKASHRDFIKLNLRESNA